MSPLMDVVIEIDTKLASIWMRILYFGFIFAIYSAFMFIWNVQTMVYIDDYHFIKLHLINKYK